MAEMLAQVLDFSFQFLVESEMCFPGAMARVCVGF